MLEKPENNSIEKIEGVPNSKLASVQFTEGEISELKRIGAIRTHAQQNCDDLSDWDKSSYMKFEVGRHDDMTESDWIGVVGEYAFAIYYDLPAPLTASKRLAGDGGYDFVAKVKSESGFESKTHIDVKTTDLTENGNFMHQKQKSFNADIYFLCIFNKNENKVHLRGFVPRCWMETANIRYDIDNPAYKISRKQAIEPPDPKMVSSSEQKDMRNNGNTIIANIRDFDNQAELNKE